jgi:hypothetical protein
MMRWVGTWLGGALSLMDRRLRLGVSRRKAAA